MIQSRDFLDAVLRNDFGAFVQRVFQTVSPGDPFEPSWHHRAIDWELSEVEFGHNRRLIINVPPRSLKSIITSVAWPAWLLGHEPTKEIVCISYSAPLGLKLARDCRRVMESEWYRRVFPGSRLQRKAEHDFQTIAGGGRYTTSVDGTLTGRGGSLVIIDDPMNASEIESEVARKKALEFFRVTAISRLNDPRTGAMVVVMQRLHEDDLAGNLLETCRWRHLCLPAVTEETRQVRLGLNELHEWRAGELLQHGRFTHEFLADQKAEMGSSHYSAQYLQAPVPAEGLMVKREWLTFYDLPPGPEAGGQIVQSWDTATKTGVFNDYSVCVMARVIRNKVYILDVFRQKLEFPALKANVLRLAREWRAKVLLIEDAASGQQLLQVLRQEQPANVPSPLPRPATTDKRTRMAGQTARIEAGDLVLPKEAPWLASYLHELLGFPQTRHDDQADATVHILSWSAAIPVPTSNAGPILFIGGVEQVFDGRNYDSNFLPGWD